jgi:hypothetical protein
MKGGGGRGWTGRREKGWWAEMRKEIGIKDSNFWLLIWNLIQIILNSNQRIFSKLNHSLNTK